MKFMGLGLVLVFSSVAFGMLGGISSVLDEITQDGSIVGVVEEREQKDNDRTMAVSLKSNKLAFKKVTVKLSKKLNEKVRVMGKPDGCNVEKSKEDLEFKDCPPAFAFKVGLEFPIESLKDFNKLARKKLEIEYSSSDGTKKQKIDIKNTPTVTPKKPGDTAFFPKTARSGHEFSITPKNGFKDGEWFVYIVDKDGKELKLDGQGLPRNEKDWGFYADNQDGLDKVVKGLKADYAMPNPAFNNKLLLEQLIRDYQDLQTGAQERADRQSKDLSDTPQFVYIPPGILGKVKVRYKNPFGEVLVDDFADTTLIKDNNPKNLTAPPKITDCTKRIFQGGELCVCGFFPSDYSRRRLLLDGKPLGAPKSGSTDNVVVLPKNLSPGKHVITWDVSAFGVIGDPDIGRKKPSASDRVEFTVLEVQASIDQNKLFTGQGTTLRLKIIGTEEKLPIALDNNTPEIVSVEGGTKQVIMTSGGPNNTIERNVKGTKRGNFDIKYKLDGPSCPCTPGDIEKKLDEEIKDDGEKTPVKTQPPANTSNESYKCREIRKSCEKKKLRLAQFKKRRQTEIANCSKLPESKRKACIDGVREQWDPIIEEEAAEYWSCTREYEECEASEDSAPVPTPQGRSLVSSGDCRKIRAECAELVNKKVKLRRELARKQSECRKRAKTKSDRDACYAELKTHYKPRIAAIQEKLKECRERLKNCDEPDSGGEEKESTKNNPPPVDESKNEEPVDCDKLTRTCLDLKRELDFQVSELLKALSSCDRNYSNRAKADACRKEAKERSQANIDKAKKALAECRVRLAKCKKDDD